MSPFPTIVLIAVRNCFSPGRECHQTSNFLFKPGNHFARGSSPVMMASINLNKAPVRFFFGMRDAPSVSFSTSSTGFGSISERQVTGIRGQQDNKNMSLERSQEDLFSITSLSSAAEHECFSYACR